MGSGARVVVVLLKAKSSRDLRKDCAGKESLIDQRKIFRFCSVRRVNFLEM